MKIVTGNRLDDGRVVYLGPDEKWTDELGAAALFDGEDASAALARASGAVLELADVYLIDAGEGPVPAGRTALRETIRSAGPTVRLDLGKQAGAHPA